MNKKLPTPARRNFIIGTAGLLVGPMLPKVSNAATKSDNVTIINYGGSYQDATMKAVFEPFTKETGIKVQIVPYPGLDKVKAMELTNNVQIDVWFGAGDASASGSKQGFWAKLDQTQFDQKDLRIAAASDYVAFDAYCRGISWDPKKFGAGKYPKNFAEFFDVKKFPGRRAIRARAVWAVEMALLADGLTPKQIYPLDLDRAFRSLDRIKSSIVWSNTTPQDISLLQSGEADFGITNVNRVITTTEPGGGVPLECSFDQVLIGTNTLAILKGAPNQENAMKLIAFYLRPDVQAKLCNLVAEVPNSKKAISMLSPDVKKWQPDPNNPNNLLIDDRYWADHYEAINRRFQEWRLS